MSFGKVACCLLIISIAVVSGLPQDQTTAPQEPIGSLPFLQFTNGGIRVNFAGYHAEAGLGGLLQSAGTRGGLHASAGTPWGAHAGAGLGGEVTGEDGTVGGGLYARAGLGRGRPEAAAGIGGKLDGSGLSANPISGGIYAGATPGGQGTGVYLGGGLGKQGIGMDVVEPYADIPYADGANPVLITKDVRVGAGANADANAGASSDASTSEAAPASETKPPTKGRTNIQIIRSRPKDLRKRKEKVVLADAALPTDTPADEKTTSPGKEMRRAVVNAVAPPASPAPPAPLATLAPSALPLAKPSVVGPLYLEPRPPVKSVDKNVIVATAPAVVVAAPVAVDQVNANMPNGNAPATIANNPNTVIARPAHPRWYFRKRFWAAPRKVFYSAAPVPLAPLAPPAPPAPSVDSQGSPSALVGEVYVNTAGNDGIVAASKTYTGGSLFDDIFNIPISTLSAVNQLLRNNFG